jgi:DNA-binding transcriptional MerR regulator
MGNFMPDVLPAIPAKRYFTIGEVSDLCGVKPYVLRYWEQEFTQLKPMKRRGNRRYYQHHEVLLIRRIRELLYDQGFTINGARNRLAEAGAARLAVSDEAADAGFTDIDFEDTNSEHDEPDRKARVGTEILVRAMRSDAAVLHAPLTVSTTTATAAVRTVKRQATGAEPPMAAISLREELLSIRDLLEG